MTLLTSTVKAFLASSPKLEPDYLFYMVLKIKSAACRVLSNASCIFLNFFFNYINLVASFPAETTFLAEEDAPNVAMFSASAPTLVTWLKVT